MAGTRRLRATFLTLLVVLLYVPTNLPHFTMQPPVPSRLEDEAGLATGEPVQDAAPLQLEVKSTIAARYGLSVTSAQLVFVQVAAVAAIEAIELVCTGYSLGSFANNARNFFLSTSRGGFGFWKKGADGIKETVRFKFDTLRPNQLKDLEKFGIKEMDKVVHWEDMVKIAKKNGISKEALKKILEPKGPGTALTVRFYDGVKKIFAVPGFRTVMHCMDLITDATKFAVAR
eukprot:TRINITY_DN50143_c0_g1_i1.p1 TRINITY_DN50143_c0_g1~~TRINITY_DN50143_c0_g1_i1.p1  ORF type:complete len:252 (+),score=42.75 TRINITY_DN50143_c0_g1_i1:69-758(+)